MTQDCALEILAVLRTIIPNPKCELNYNNNFELISAIMLSAQTTDKRVNLVTAELFKRYPTPLLLAGASFSDVYAIIKPLGFANAKASNLIALAKVIHEKYDDEVPSAFNDLVALPGVGRKTANVFLIEGLKIPAIPVDTHVNRIAYRLQFVDKVDNPLKTEEALMKYIPKENWIEAHHLFLLFGRYYCKAIKPSCSGCRLKVYCKEK